MFSQPLIIGATYRLKFKSIFERHGVCTTPGVTCLHEGGGVFRLEQITNFRDLNLAGIKLYDVFFKPLGVSEADYQKYFDGKPDDEYTPEYTTKVVENETTEQETTIDEETQKVILVDHKVVTKHLINVETGKSILTRRVQDEVNYAKYPIYKFVDVIDANDILYVPELTIDGFPEISIREYRDLTLAVHLGYMDDPKLLDPMLLAIRERMATYGWQPSLIRLYSTGKKWMSPSEYEAIKSLRIPATVETITEATQSEAEGKYAIIDGQLKKIVRTVTDPLTELQLDAITSHEQIIDNNLFLVKCGDSDRFETGCSYYRQATNTVTVDGKEKGYIEWHLLREGFDFSPGDPCVTYVKCTEGAKGERYKLVSGEYVALRAGEHANYPIETLFFRKETTTDPGEETETTTVTYEPATKEQYDDEDIVLYIQKAESYEKDDDGDLIKVSDVFKECYSTILDITGVNPGALALMGNNFKYTDVYGKEDEITLRLEDIIALAALETSVTLPREAGSDWDSYWKPYIRRKFRYIVYPNDKDHTDMDTIEVTISDLNKPNLVGKTGYLLGQSGIVSVETYIKDSSLQNRNYYMRYVIQSKLVEAQRQRITILEEALIQQSKK